MTSNLLTKIIYSTLVQLSYTTLGMAQMLRGG